MAEDASLQEPQTARRVPSNTRIQIEGSDGSPPKPIFDEDDEDWKSINTKAHALNASRIPNLDPDSLPPLPSSLLSPEGSPQYPRSDDGRLEEGFDMNQMRRHLMDVESSFLPALSPVGTAGQSGIDDTYLFEGSNQRRSGIWTPVKQAANVELPDSDVATSPETPADMYKTPGLPRNHSEHDDNQDEGDYGNTTSSLETLSSSPTAAAAARTISRAISQASLGGYESMHTRSVGQGLFDTDNEDSYEHHDEHNDHNNGYGGEQETTPTKAKQESDEDYGHYDQHPSDDDGRYSQNHEEEQERHDLLMASSAGRTPGAGLSSLRYTGGPRILRSSASTQSSLSSFVSNPEGSEQGASDSGHGADFALQTGGAAVEGLSTRGSSVQLSRTVSLGSMASGLDDDGNDSHSRISEPLETLDEEEQNRIHIPESLNDNGMSPPETPRAITGRSIAEPTDTVIAQHVRNVQVPESLAKQYRNEHQVTSPVKSRVSAPLLGRGGKTMTLREQSSTIERLSKENFDLKLKVMFLNSRLDKLSEEGVKEMISENVELKTGLAVMQRDNKALKRKIKELEKKLKDEEGRPDTAKSGNTSSDGRSPKWDDSSAQDREELIYLRERTEEYLTEIEKLRNESMTRENEKRKLAEVVKTLSERRGEFHESRDEVDVWKDLLESETARRELVDEENKKLKDEINRLKNESTTPTTPGFSRTNNIYNITKRSQMSPSRPRSGFSHQEEHTTFSSTSTLVVDELRREADMLKHENAELRREVGAQTSMLTSRNREKERLYQEIEELKLGQRRGGGSVAGDSILERSASRSYARSYSRATDHTLQAALEDDERDEYETKNAELRDKINELKMQNQEYQRELQQYVDALTETEASQEELEARFAELEEEFEISQQNLQAMQVDRNDALQVQEETEEKHSLLQQEYEALKNEAQETIDTMDGELEERVRELQRLETELANTTEDFEALQTEMRSMSEAVVKLEDIQISQIQRIEQLELEVQERDRELEEMDLQLHDANDNVGRLTVQAESSQGEIDFLRDEQETDKMKINDLEIAVKNSENSLASERDRAKELETRLSEERQQREMVASQEKQEVQKMINDLNKEASAAKEEARKLRKDYMKEQVEGTATKERLNELENNLRHALGDLNGTRSSLLKNLAKLQRDLENTVRDLDSTRATLADKERLLKNRDTLLESHGLESRKLSELLDKERAAHRNTKHQFETYQRTTHHTSRTATQKESQVQDLEASRAADRKKFAALEIAFKEQLTERNTLLLQLWNRLSALCGSDWSHANALISGRALPSLEAVGTMLPGFAKNLLNAVKCVENVVTTFKTKVRTVERDLLARLAGLESGLDSRSKRVDHLESLVKSMESRTAAVSSREVEKLKSVNRALRAEVAGIKTEGRNMSDSGSAVGSEAAFQYQLREMERRLAAEREGRLLDRRGARNRLEEGEIRIRELEKEIERWRLRSS